MAEPVIKLCEWFDDHFYKIVFDDGAIDYYPSYTTKLGAAPKPFLSRWRGDIGNREADQRMYDASEKGKRIHYACALIADGGIVLYNPFNKPNYTKEAITEIQEKIDREVFILQDQDDQWQVAKFVEWMKTVNPVVAGNDVIVYDKEHREAGTIDFIFDIAEGSYSIAGAKPMNLNAGRYVVDLKSGSGIYDEYFLQIAGYGHNVDGVVGGLLIHTNAHTKKGIEGLTTILRTAEEMAADYESFRHVAAVWERMNPDPTPKMIDFPSLLTLRSDYDLQDAQAENNG